MKNPTIAINEFVRRQTDASSFGHFDGNWEVLIELTREHFHKNRPGAGSEEGDGIVLVPVPAQGFWSSVVPVSACQDKIIRTHCGARRESELPFLSHQVDGVGKIVAQSVDIVCYRHDVLAKKNEYTTVADYEIVSINAHPTEQEVPMDPVTMARNALDLEGGTLRTYSNEEWAYSTWFWAHHVQLADGYRHVRIKTANLNEISGRLNDAKISHGLLEEETEPHPRTGEPMTQLKVACSGSRFHKLIADIADVVHDGT